MIRSITRATTTRRGLLAGASALTATGLLGRTTRAADPQALSVALDWYPNANHAGLFLAAERGAFTAAGLAPEFYVPADPTSVLQTVGAGKDDLGISYQSDVLLARAAGVPVVAIAALAQQPLQCVMSLQSAGITRPADLRGATIGYPGIPSQEAVLATMLEQDGLTLADITLVNVGFDLLPSVVSGRCAAVMGAFWTHETIIAEREGYEVAIMRPEEWGVPAYYELVLVASETSVGERMPELQAFVAAMRQGYLDAIANPAAALDALAAAEPELDRGVEEQGLALLAPVWTAGDVLPGHQDAARWADFAAWMAGRGLIPADLDPAAAWTAASLPADA
jgi:putative hydroxymethylpyrimidine transport system substrate-binding protein